MPAIGRLLFAVVVLSTVASFDAAEPVRYRLSFPEPQHRWMQVAAMFPDVAHTTIVLRMSRSAPGRYPRHAFCKNVARVRTFDKSGHEAETTRPDPYGWNVSDRGGGVTIKYKVYGDRVDGTYLGVDTTHAHINMPAALIWAHGF